MKQPEEKSSYVLKFEDITKFIDTIQTEPRTTSVFEQTAAKARKEVVDQLLSSMAKHAYEVRDSDMKFIGGTENG